MEMTDLESTEDTAAAGGSSSENSGKAKRDGKRFVGFELKCIKFFRESDRRSIDVNYNICGYCNQIFHDQQTLFYHIDRQHSTDNTENDEVALLRFSYKCRACGESLSSKKLLQKHFEKKHAGRFNCPQCDVVFEDYVQLVRHCYLLHAVPSYLPCDLCENFFSTKEDVSEHLRKIHIGLEPEETIQNDCGTEKPDDATETFVQDVDSVPSTGSVSAEEEEEPSFCRKKKKRAQTTPSKVDTAPKIYKCNQCDQSFATYKLLKIHYRSHVEQRNVCTYCNKGFSNHSDLLMHMRSHTGVKSFSCNQCDKAYTQKAYLRVHERLHTGETPYKCSICNAGFRCRRDVTFHTRSKHKISLTCDHCKKTFDNKTELDNHCDKEHKNPDLLKCDLCDKIFDSHHELSEHANEHLRDNHYSCKICFKNFKDPHRLKNHHTAVHKQVKPYQCHECGKFFFTNSSLRIHMRSHSGEKPFMCDECGKSFSGAGMLVVHKKTHNSEAYTFACDRCDKRFYRNAALQNHYRIHTGERPFICDTCGNSYKHRNTLRIHKRSHTGERPFKCDLCSKTYKDSSRLLQHKRWHMGEKPYACKLCDVRYAGLRSIKDHMAKFHSQTSTQPPLIANKPNLDEAGLYFT